MLELRAEALQVQTRETRTMVFRVVLWWDSESSKKNKHHSSAMPLRRGSASAKKFGSAAVCKLLGAALQEQTHATAGGEFQGLLPDAPETDRREGVLGATAWCASSPPTSTKWHLVMG